MATVSASPLLIEDAAGLRTLVLNRPERRNALSHALLNDLIAALAETAADTSVHAVIVRGEGPGFCAGHDLSEMAGCSLPSAQALFETCSEMMMAIHRLPQPVIAQVHGIATAAGCQLVAACDLAIASEDARFATSGVRYGLFCSTPMVEVSRAIGRKRALEMLLTGDMIDAQTAADWGLVNRVVPREQPGRGHTRAGQAHHHGELARARGRQDGLLRADPPRTGRGLRPHDRGHGGQRRGPRRTRGHRRVSGQARAELARPRRLSQSSRRKDGTSRMSDGTSKS